MHTPHNVRDDARVVGRQKLQLDTPRNVRKRPPAHPSRSPTRSCARITRARNTRYHHERARTQLSRSSVSSRAFGRCVYLGSETDMKGPGCAKRLMHGLHLMFLETSCTTYLSPRADQRLELSITTTKLTCLHTDSHREQRSVRCCRLYAS